MECSRQEYWSGLPFPTESCWLSAICHQFKSSKYGCFTKCDWWSQSLKMLLFAAGLSAQCFFWLVLVLLQASLVAQMVKNLPAMQKTRLERSPGEGNGNPLWYSCLENFMDRGAWRASSSQGPKESDMTERLTLSLLLFLTHSLLKVEGRKYSQ